MSPRIAARQLWAFFFALTFAGCTTAYTTTAASLTAAEKIVQAASDQYPPFDKQKRDDIVKQAPNRAAGAAALIEWDQTSEKVVRSIEGAHASVKLGADGLKGVREGKRNPKELSAWIAPAIRVGTDLVALLKAIGLELKGL